LTRDSLQARKQQLVRSAIFDAAIELFATKGFDETTVEEVAQSAGVSRRSFFRYFASKDDLLAQNVIQYGVALTAAIAACPSTFTPLEVVQETVLSVAKHTVANPRTRQVIEISERSASAKQAQMSRLVEVEDDVATAFAARLRSASKYDLRPRLLASLTISSMNVAIIAWFRGEYQDLSTAAKQVFSNLTRIVCDQTNSNRSKPNATTKAKTGNSPQPAKIPRVEAVNQSDPGRTFPRQRTVSPNRGGYPVSMSDLPGGKPASAGRICVFCGSSVGANPKYLIEAKSLGQQMAGGGWGMVYGGTSVGLMGAIADAALSGGGEVIGVLPQALQDREVAHQGLTKLHMVGSMHERKALMASLSDAFIALPGGYGTLDEFFEIVTWAQLNIHSKPCVLINTDGYYDFLLRFLDHAVREEFVRPVNLRLVQTAADCAEALHWIEQQRDKASLNQNVSAQNGDGPKP